MNQSSDLCDAVGDDSYNDYISFHTWRRWHRQMILARASLAVGALVVLAVVLY